MSQKVSGSRKEQNQWDEMWRTRSVESEVLFCEIHSACHTFERYLSKTGSILEGGSGIGKWVIYLKKKGYNIIGIENNSIAIKKCREYDATLPIVQGDICHLPFISNSFSYYISMGIIEHFEEGPDIALNEANRVLEPNGLIFVSEFPSLILLER